MKIKLFSIIFVVATAFAVISLDSPRSIAQSATASATPSRTPTRPPAPLSCPYNATARCVDGSCSFSQSRSGACSGHGGVAQWLK